jgi:hypothetical protein
MSRVGGGGVGCCLATTGLSGPAKFGVLGALIGARQIGLNMQRKDLPSVNNGGPAVVAGTAVSLALLLGHAAAQAAQRYDDGSATAPAGQPLMPSILAHYAARPPWKVAAVDYAVGVPAGTRLMDPAAIAIGGVSVNAGNHTIVVTGSNVTISGYDFGRSGGWGVYVDAKATNTVVQNSSFVVGANHVVPINAGAGSGNLAVLNNTFDATVNTGEVWALVNYNGSGRFIAQYNIFAHSPDDAIDFGPGSMTTVVRYNLFENLGTDPQAHADAVQYVSTTSTNSIISFNTVYQSIPSGNQGLQIEAQNGSSITNTTVANNVILARDNGKTMSYSIFVGADSGANTIDGVMVANNYIDFSGAYGPFYTPTGSHLTYTGNVDMTRGRLLASPEPRR